MGVSHDPVLAVFDCQPRATLHLIGCDSSMGAILDAATSAAADAGWTQYAVNLLRHECFASEYHAFLCLLMDVFDVPIPEGGD